MHMHTRMCVCRRVEPSSSAYRWPTPTPPSSVSRTGATAAPTAQRHFATARQQLSAKCRAMQDQAEHDLLQCDSSALLHRWGSSSMSTHAHTEHTPSSCMLEALTPLPETHPTRASLVGQPLTKVCLSQVSHRKHGEDPDRARGPDCAPRQPAPRASTVPRPPHRTLRTGAARGALRLSWLHRRAALAPACSAESPLAACLAARRAARLLRQAPGHLLLGPHCQGL